MPHSRPMPQADPHWRPDHHYPWLPPGVRICDDETAGGAYFYYRDREFIVHQQDYPDVTRWLRRLGFLEEEDYARAEPSPRGCHCCWSG